MYAVFLYISVMRFGIPPLFLEYFYYFAHVGTPGGSWDFGGW